MKYKLLDLQQLFFKCQKRDKKQNKQTDKQKIKNKKSKKINYKKTTQKKQH